MSLEELMEKVKAIEEKIEDFENGKLEISKEDFLSNNDWERMINLIGPQLKNEKKTIEEKIKNKLYERKRGIDG